MTDTLRPRDAKDVVGAVEWALAGSKTLEVIGHGSKRAIGRAAQWDHTLDLGRLSGVTLYEPDELVLSAKAATPLAEIEALLAAKGQELAFEPMDYGPILGHAPGRGTLGGALCANLSGPRRLKAGAARDHFLGVTAVSGRGEIFKSGGRVVKNVTGYDLCKLLAGSWGTLAVMTDVTVKVLPRAETEESVMVLGLDDRTAVKAMALVAGSACEASGIAHLPAPVAARLAGQASGGRSITAFRFEGVGPSVAHRQKLVEGMMKPYGALLVVGARASQALWRGIRDVTPFAAEGGSAVRPLWRISTTPTEAPDLVARIAAKAECEVLYDWAGGLVWIRLAYADDAGAKLVRRAAAPAGGHATLIRATPSVRAAVSEIFEPQERALAALTKRVKESFDPQGILGPGRMFAGV